ncbi:ergothioneine biosynthesis glutamate--cysteine ligase EgtA [Williamsia sp. CHRR-6]|uniref:ergothioneine biosynthesis glutamate--cysteine ligase EgtA n=1 Tax=Williamsia sp. CHRR-6 TaxID=2835871 RepID=UPI001BDB2951|nr:ergothioneine biosynthesis glutamate--cysteine ligase EgtA [Williamsia sp. CHRR-6]MBT0567284.1 ergothioneine biosynthesis glutamate--cysteine ligase EgtA [Williamsia sp. CHRR-6]
MTTSTGELSSRPAAAAYLTRVCFKLGPPQLIGAELEWFTADVRAPSGADPVICSHLSATTRRPDLELLATALGSHAPTTIAPDSPALPLSSGSIVTVEPGGQIELSSRPFADAATLRAALAADEHQLRGLLAAHGIVMIAGAADGFRPPHRLLSNERYAAMEASYSRGGVLGRLMMCNTAAVQVAVDAGATVAHAMWRFGLLHAIGPALIAAFANSPRLHGVDDESWASQRMRTWLGTDRSRVPPHGQTVDDYTEWVLDVPLLCVRCADGSLWSPPAGTTVTDWIDGHLDERVGRRPTAADLDYHVSTVFPMVRPKGYLEVRYLDGQPPGMWGVPISAVAALLSTDEVGAAAMDIVADTVDAWHTASVAGLRDPQLRVAASHLLTLAADATDSPTARNELGVAAARCARGHTPADEATITDPAGKDA